MSVIFAGPLLHELEHLLLALLAVRDVLLEARLGLLDHVAVAGADPRQAELLEPFERLQVDGHVPAAARVHHRPHAVEHGVAGEEHALLLEQEAEVVGRVARGVQHVEAELGALDRRALADDPIGDDVAVLVGAALREGQHLGAGLLHEPGGAR